VPEVIAQSNAGFRAVGLGIATVGDKPRTLDENKGHLLAGDDVVVEQSGEKTHGMGRSLFRHLPNAPIPGLSHEFCPLSGGGTAPVISAGNCATFTTGKSGKKKRAPKRHASVPRVDADAKGAKSCQNGAYSPVRN